MINELCVSKGSTFQVLAALSRLARQLPTPSQTIYTYLTALQKGSRRGQRAGTVQGEFVLINSRIEREAAEDQSKTMEGVR